jgi:hypothetical protein
MTTDKPSRIVLEALNGMTLTLVPTEDGLTLRVAKDGHNRAIAKLSPEQRETIASYLSDGGER